MEFEGGKTASFSMVAFTKEICTRITRIHGTHGQLEGDGYKITVTNFRYDIQHHSPEIFIPSIF